jgi:nitroimidazol reductase NimA-like FMN-containing flavoprotein (pyridoxamine 5'-phosphate oxidase superfamily)
MKSPKSTVKRQPKRGAYDAETIYSILDKDFHCHVGFVHHGSPIVIPTLYGRSGNKLYLHGASVSRLMTTLSEGIDVCISVAQINGLVLARSAFHHSANYESVVLFGKARLIEGDEKMKALEVISEQVLKGRWDEVRQPNEKEMKATSVLEFEIEEGSAKRRAHGVSDDKEDMDLDIWAGVVPIRKVFDPPEDDAQLKPGLKPGESVKKIYDI